MLGVFGLSVRTRERDIEDEFSKMGPVEKVVIVYDQRVRSLSLSLRRDAELTGFYASLNDRGDSDSLLCARSRMLNAASLN